MPPPRDPNSRTTQLRLLLEERPSVSHTEAAKITGLTPGTVRNLRSHWMKPPDPNFSRRVGASNEHYRCRYWPHCEAHPGWPRPKKMSAENEQELVEIALEGATIEQLAFYFDSWEKTVSKLLASRGIARW